MQSLSDRLAFVLKQCALKILGWQDLLIPQSFATRLGLESLRFIFVVVPAAPSVKLASVVRPT